MRAHLSPCPTPGTSLTADAPGIDYRLGPNADDRYLDDGDPGVIGGFFTGGMWPKSLDCGHPHYRKFSAARSCNPLMRMVAAFGDFVGNAPDRDQPVDDERKDHDE